jgi:fructosamine-3-kinase
MAQTLVRRFHANGQHKLLLKPLSHLLDFEAIEEKDSSIIIEPLAEGTWNQIFRIYKNSGTKEFVFCVSKPVFPWFKVESEVATMKYVSLKTSIPVPRVYAYDSSANDILGYE